MRTIYPYQSPPPRRRLTHWLPTRSSNFKLLILICASTLVLFWLCIVSAALAQVLTPSGQAVATPTPAPTIVPTPTPRPQPTAKLTPKPVARPEPQC